MTDPLAIVESHKSNNAEYEVQLGLNGVIGPPRTKSNRSRLVDLFYATFLPVGYPGTVREGYVRYQLWDLFQGLCTYLRMTLAVKALLEGLGVGDAEASVIGGSLLWVAKDGTQMLASLVFSYFSATEMGLHVRQWRLFADVANDIGLTLNVSAPLFGPWFLLVTCMGSAFMAVTGVCAHATKTSISEHFALASLSDCVTKEGTQETGVQLIGLVGGAFIVKWLGEQQEEDKIVRLWSVFTVLTALHMYANMRAVATLRFHYVNEIRFRLLFDAFREGSNMGIEHIAISEPRLPVSPWRRKRVLMGERLSTLAAVVRPEALQSAWHLHDHPLQRLPRNGRNLLHRRPRICNANHAGQVVCGHV